MSVNMDTSDTTTQYSDYEHEILDFSASANTGGTNVFGLRDVEPLSNRGGIDSDEVAEIVAMDIEFSVLPEGGGSTANKYVFRGAYGANLDYEDIPQNTPSGVPEIDVSNLVEDQSDSQTFPGTPDGAGGVYATENTGAFGQFHIGCGGSYAVNKWEQHDFRERFGRGPVLDTTDDLAVVFGFVSEDANDAGAEAHVRTKIVYDVATVEGTRSRFSLPQQLE